MGLDNGIMLKIKNKEKFGDTRKLYSMFSWTEEGSEYALLYWRKCWNVRREISEVLADAYNNGNAEHDKYFDDGINDYIFNLKAFKDILVRLRKIYKKSWWEENDDSIWSWDECGSNYKSWLIKAWKVFDVLKDKDADSYELSFYDSY